MSTETKLPPIKRGIRDDGTVEGHVVETHWLPIDRAAVVPGPDGYLALVCDAGPIDYEVRVPLTLCRDAAAPRDEPCACTPKRRIERPVHGPSCPHAGELFHGLPPRDREPDGWIVESADNGTFLALRRHRSAAHTFGARWAIQGEESREYHVAPVYRAPALPASAVENHTPDPEQS